MSMSNWTTFNITAKGPFDLKRTVESGHSSFPIPLTDKQGRYYFIMNIPKSNKKVITRIGQKGSKLQTDITLPQGTIEKDELSNMKKLIRSVFGLNISLLEFYEEFNNDPIAKTFKNNPGLRLTQAYDLFESLICSILTQNNSVWRFNSQIRKIKELMGEKYPSEHFMIYSFPEPKVLFRNKHLLKDAKLGYREEYVVDVTEDIANYQFRLEKLNSLPTMEAKKQLLKLKGVGSKVADMFLLYGLGRIDAPPTDIWIQRGVCKMFYRGREKSLEECRDKLVNHYGKWAGLAQLYLFDYMRSTNQKK